MIRPQPVSLSMLGGWALAGVFIAMTALRRPRPIHPDGLTLTGSLRWHRRPNKPAGLRWIDEPPSDGEATVTARMSRSIGLPSALPDIQGLALRITTPDGTGDLELASTGFDVPGRFMLLLHRSPSRAWFNTLIPYRGEQGPVLIAARPRHPDDLPAGLPGIGAALNENEWVLELMHAALRGPWRPFAELRLADPTPDSAATTFRYDAVRRPLPGTNGYRWAQRLREPAYRAVQGPLPGE